MSQGNAAMKLGMYMSSEAREIDKWLEIVRISFIYENDSKQRSRVYLDFLVLEGTFWGIVNGPKDAWYVARPWAQYLDLADVSISKIK